MIHSQTTGSVKTEPKKQVILDSIAANAIDNIILEGQQAKRELDSCSKIKQTQSVYIIQLKSYKKTADSLQIVSDTIISDQAKRIKNDNVIIKRKDRKITFWKIVSGVSLALFTYIAVVK